MYDDLPTPASHVTRARVLFGVAAVLTLALVALFPAPSAYGLGYFLGTVAVATVIRFLYVKVRRRAQLPLASGWIFVIALVFALLATPGRLRDHTRFEAANASAERNGLAATADEATAADRCLAIALDEWETTPQVRSAMPKAYYRTVATRVCEMAEREGALYDDGSIPDEDLQEILLAVADDMRAEAAARK